MLKIISWDDEPDKALAEACTTILKGGVLIYPTDTLYGIGGNAENAAVVKRIRNIKKRDTKPLSVMMADIQMIKKYCELGKEQEQILEKYLPGPYTFILKTRKIIAASATGTLGVRIPDSEFTKRLCSKANVTIIITSVNISGEKPAEAIGDIEDEIKNAVDLIIETKEKTLGGYTVVDLVNKKILRQGAGRVSFR